MRQVERVRIRNIMECIFGCDRCAAADKIEPREHRVGGLMQRTPRDLRHARMQAVDDMQRETCR